MDQVVLLSLTRGEPEVTRERPSPRVPVLECRDAIRAAGAAVDLVSAASDAEVDEVLDALPKVRVVVVAEAAGQLRAVVRRLVRRYAPAPSARPADLPADRTIADLPPLGVLPLAGHDWLRMPANPAVVAEAVTGDRVRRIDLLRTDAGSVTIDGVLLGAIAADLARSGAGVDDDRGHAPFRARIEVDDVVLSAGEEPLLAAVLANAAGYATIDGLPMVTDPDPADGIIDVAVALPTRRRRFGWGTDAIEVRRASGRAVSVQPSGPVPLLDDGVLGTMQRRRTWWMERAALALHVP